MRHLGFAVIAAMCLGLAGCYPEPFQNPGDWAPTGAAKEDLAMQAADKDDLLAGRSAVSVGAGRRLELSPNRPPA